MKVIKGVAELLPIHVQQTRRRVVSLILSIFLVTLAPAANAITKHLSMIGENGQPLANTTITITFSDGTKQEEDTDDKGILMFNFSKSGVYTLSDPAGNVIKTVSIAGSGFNSKAVTFTAVVAGSALLLAVASSGSSGDSSTDTPADPGAGDPGSDIPDEEEPVGAGGGLAGTYNVTTTIASNPGDLPVLIDTLVLQLEIIGTQLTILQISSNPNFPSQLSGTIAGESFSASSNGTYGGFQTLFQLAGSITAAQALNFLINIGSDGSLPDGQGVTYNATGTK